MGADLGPFHTKKSPENLSGALYERRLADLGQQLVKARFRVAVKHPRILFIEQRILDTRVTSTLATLRHNHLLGVSHF